MIIFFSSGAETEQYTSKISEIYQGKDVVFVMRVSCSVEIWLCPQESHVIRTNLVLLKEANYSMKKSWSRIFALTMGIPLLLALLAACGSGTTGGGSSTTPAVTGSTTIKVATDLPTSGKDATSGKPAENGAHLAVDQANANHTVPNVTFQFVPKDDVGPSGVHDPAIGAQNVTALAGDARVVGVVGPLNSNVAKAE